MKQFKSRKVKKKKKIIPVLFVFFFFFSYVFMVKYFTSNKLNNNILKPEYNYILFDVRKVISNKITNDINKPVNLLSNNVKSAIKIETKKVNNDFKKSGETKDKVEKKEAIKEEKLPTIYVYNTHQTEMYADYSVYDAAMYLSDLLNNNGFSTYFEEKSIATFLQDNNLKYYKSYYASRNYLNEAKQKYNTINYFFDIHRDSINKDKSTITHNGKNYAKVLFVVGTDNKENEKNKISSNKLNDIIKSKIPNISRGIVCHGGKEYNGVYNQDISENVFLIEIGGVDNTKEEVLNTVNVIYESIKEYIRGII